MLSEIERHRAKSMDMPIDFDGAVLESLMWDIEDGRWAALYVESSAVRLIDVNLELFFDGDNHG